MIKIGVLRLGHRPERDKRITTHVALVARAFGADFMTYSGKKDEKIEENIRNIVKKWGGNFKIKYVKNWKKLVKGWEGKIVHLTMYGIPIQNKINEIRKCKKDLLVIVGGEKVPIEVYQLADWNIAITNQPHSEVSSLCYFLDYFFDRKELSKEFKNAKIKIIPSERGKKVVEI
jgi:tRNA (cytidine56-2'-O)-methyltransferase